MKTPLAWKNLTHDRKRLLLALGGIGFAVLLMFMQLGFRGALFDSTLALLKTFDGELVLINPQRYTLTVFQKFPREYLRLAEAAPDVVRASPVYVENIRSFWQLEGDSIGPSIRVVAFDPRQTPIASAEVIDQADLLLETGAVLYDRKSKPEFGDVRVGSAAEVNGRRIRVAGEFALGTDFADDGTILCSDRTFQTLFYTHLPADEGLRQVDVGLLKLRDGVDIERARRAVDALLPPEVIVLTKPEYLAFELKYWSNSTPIGYVFAFGTIMGFIVGMVICYQILFSDIADHMREFATLKAMGYRPRYFVGVVLQEALLLSFLGFLPGLAAAFGLYEAVTWATGLVMDLGAARVVGVLVLTMLMCVVSGCLTMRKVLVTDPAELF